LGRLRLTSQPFAKLCLDHAECGFYVAALRDSEKETLRAWALVMKQSPPKLTARLARRVSFEWNEWRRAVVYHSLQVVAADVALVGYYFFHLESRPCSLFK
jgi:hypothetical protein